MKRDQTSCQGQLVSFSDLRKENRTTKDLFSWHVLIDILNDYEMFRDNAGEEQMYCQCIRNTIFGNNCKYILNELMNNQSLQDLIFAILTAVSNTIQIHFIRQLSIK